MTPLTLAGVCHYEKAEFERAIADFAAIEMNSRSAAAY
jgi:hypothetical protein